MRAIVNVAVGGNYEAGQKRLAESLDAFDETADRLFFTDWPRRSHLDVPYGFKPDAFSEALRASHSHVLWLDASCWLVKPLDAAWGQIEADGYLLGQEGWSLGQWCRQEVLEEAGLTREEANRITLIEGKMIGLDLGSDTGKDFLDAWMQASEDGWFNGDWSNHRHDISAGAIIAHRMGLKLTPHLIEIAHGKSDPHPDVYVQASGM